MNFFAGVSNPVPPDEEIISPDGGIIFFAKKIFIFIKFLKIHKIENA